MPSITETLGDFVARTEFDAIPAAVIERAKISLVHNFAVALAGRSRPQPAARAAERAWSVPREATLLATGARVATDGAAFANAALIHTGSQDDTHAGSTSHPGAPVIAPALALAEATHASGAAFLRAVVLGYEVLGRIGRDFDEKVTARGYRAASVFGVFGAAASSACLLGLSGAETAHALGLATHMAGGTAQVWAEGSAEGPLQLGFAARNGLCAARAAEAGATAARDALEGRAGLYSAVAGATEPPTEALAGLGAAWQVTEATVKPHPVCAILQGPVDALLDLMRTHDIAADDITDIALTLAPYEAAYPGVDNGGPFASAIATKLSAQFSLALALADGRVSFAGLHRLEDPAVLALSRTVRVIADPAVAPRLSRVAVTRRDGAVLRATIDAPVGQPDFAGIARFARELAPEMAMPVAAVDAIIDAVATLDTAPDLTALVRSMLVQVPA